MTDRKKFKVGDSVRVANLGSKVNGVRGVVQEIWHHDAFKIRPTVDRPDGYGRDWFVMDGIFLVSDTVPGPDPVDPDHYKFPGGVEVISISEHLTSNGGQAVQYIARATRIDGKVKGEPLEDLRKAKWFIEREIERLSGA